MVKFQYDPWSSSHLLFIPAYIEFTTWGSSLHYIFLRYPDGALRILYLETV